MRVLAPNTVPLTLEGERSEPWGLSCNCLTSRPSTLHSRKERRVSRPLGPRALLAVVDDGGDVSEHLVSTDCVPHSTSRICIVLLTMHKNTKIVIRLLSPLRMRAAGHRAFEQLAHGHRAGRIQTQAGWVPLSYPSLVHIGASDNSYVNRSPTQ